VELDLRALASITHWFRAGEFELELSCDSVGTRAILRITLFITLLDCFQR